MKIQSGNQTIGVTFVKVDLVRQKDILYLFLVTLRHPRLLCSPKIFKTRKFIGSVSSIEK